VNKRTTTILILNAILLACFPAMRVSANYTLVWDTRDIAQMGQMTVYNGLAEGSLLGMPVAAGDVNGDGYDDVSLAAFYGPSGPSGGRRAAGQVNIAFGSADALKGTTVDFSKADQGSCRIYGARADDFLGNEIAMGDVNGDGFADIIAGAQNGDGFDNDSNRSQAGLAYIVLGQAEYPAVIDLVNPGPGVIQILGAKSGDRFGFWVHAGDVTGDDIDDILVSADLAGSSSGTGSARGVLYMIPGGQSFPAKIDLSQGSVLGNLHITAIYGKDDLDHFGSCIAVGDFDGDGFGDIACSAGVSRAGAAYTGYGQVNNGIGQGGGDGPNDDRQNAGEVTVLYGRASWPSTIQLSSPPGDATIVYGDQAGGYFGEDVNAGDFDGDGLDELVVGALVADAPGGRNGSGIGYVVWGDGFDRGDRIDIRSASGARVLTIYGENAGDIGADSIRLADIDGDGFEDILFGSPINAASGREAAGDLKIIYGTEAPMPSVVDTANNPASVPIFQVVAPDAGDMFTYSLTTGDIDGDGFIDLVPNAMGGDGAGNRLDACGESYIISGRIFAQRTGRGTQNAPILSSVTVFPDRKKIYAGESGIVLTLNNTSPDTERLFTVGSTAVVNDVDVPTEFVDMRTLRVSLDEAPDTRNTPGSLVVQARNPGSDPSVAIVSVLLIGPIVKKVTSLTTDVITLTVKGKNALDGASVDVRLAEVPDMSVPVMSIDRTNKKTFKVRIGRQYIAPGSRVEVRIVNPGPAYSQPASVIVM